MGEGTWGYYERMCNPKDAESCIVFLPDEEQIKAESPIIGSSSMILLKNAYAKLAGEDRKFVETRIRNLYKSISKKETLKRKTIEQIYQELFSDKLSMDFVS